MSDAALFHATDSSGFLIGYLAGTAVAAISAVAYGAGFGFIGFYIVRPGYRGQGHGLRIWRAAMVRLDGRIIGLDGVIEQQDNYRKSGFAFAHRNIRFGGVVASGIDGRAGSGEIVDCDAVGIDSLAAYDAPFFAAPRFGFLAGWLTSPRHVGKVLIRDGRVAGFGVVRPCLDGAKIGPLFADDATAADDLFRALAVSVAAPIFLDAPEPNGAALALAERYGLAPCFETARMYAGRAPELPLQRLYGITTFELG